MTCTPIAPNPAGGFRQLWGLRRDPAVDASTAEKAGAAGPWLTGRIDRKDLRLRIVHVNDTHHFHLGGACDVDPSTQSTPLESVKALIAAGRHAGIDTLYLSAGDEHTGTCLDELLGYTPEQFSRSVAYELQSAVGLDAAAVGNHDLDRGPAILEQAARMSASFPLLSANLMGSRHFTTFYHALVGVTAAALRVAVIALTTEEQVQVRSKLDDGLRISDPLEAARFWIDSLSESVDVVVLLSHLGLNEPGSRHTVRIDDRALARAISHTDRRDTHVVIIGAHTHSVIDHETSPLRIGGIPVFQAGCNLEHAGIIDIEGRRMRGRIVRLEATRLKDPAMAARARSAAEELSTTVTRRVTIIGNRERAHGEAVLEDRLTGECSLADMICDMVRKHVSNTRRQDPSQRVVVACDASGIQGGIGDSAELCVEDLYRILPYADSLYQAVVGPDALQSILASNVSRRLPPGSLRTNGGTVDPTNWPQIARGFLHFSGNLRYRAGQSGLLEASLDGVSLSRLPRSEGILVVCNSFSAMGNQGWGPADAAAFEEFGAVSLPALSFEDLGQPLRQVLIAALSEEAEVEVVTDGRAIFDSE